MRESQHPRLRKILRQLQSGAALTPGDVSLLLDWQLQLPEEKIDCALILECQAYLHPDESDAAPGKAEVWAGVLAAIAKEPAAPKQPDGFHRRARGTRRWVAIVLAALLLIALAATAIGALFRLNVFNFKLGMLFPEYVYTQETADTLLQENLLTVPFPHVEVSVRQAMYDGHELRILYAMRDLEATERVQPPDNPEWVTPAAELDGLTTVGDWIEIDDKHDYPSQCSAMAGDEPGEMLYYVELQPADPSLAERESFTVGLPILWENGRKVVPDGLRFTVATKDLAELTRSAEPAVLEWEGVRFSLDSARFSPVSASVSLTLRGKSDQELDDLSMAWGAAAVYDASGVPVGITSAMQWSFQVKGQVTIEYQVIPPSAWPEEMILAMPNAQGEPDPLLRLPIKFQ